MTTRAGTTAPLRIVVADDQASVREGLVALLALLPDIDVVASAANGEQAIQAVADERPDAILLDLRMPVLDGIETTRRLTRDHPNVAVVVLTTYDDDSSIVDALRAGARSYLTKSADRVEIAHALRSAVAGLSVLGTTVQSKLLAAATPHTGTLHQPQLPHDLPGGLTRREAEILSLIAQGATNPAIAARLHLSAHTVKSHINRIFTKTGSTDRSEAIRFARDHGLGYDK